MYNEQIKKQQERDFVKLVEMGLAKSNVSFTTAIRALALAQTLTWNELKAIDAVRPMEHDELANKAIDFVHYHTTLRSWTPEWFPERIK